MIMLYPQKKSTNSQQRHGSGVYSYLDPALADGFATSCTSSPYRVMIACDVIVSSGSKRRRGGDSVSIPLITAT